MSRPQFDWEHIEWLRSFNRSWDTIALDLGVDTGHLVNAYQVHRKRAARKKATAWQR